MKIQTNKAIEKCTDGQMYRQFIQIKKYFFLQSLVTNSFTSQYLNRKTKRQKEMKTER